MSKYVTCKDPPSSEHPTESDLETGISTSEIQLPRTEYRQSSSSDSTRKYLRKTTTRWRIKRFHVQWTILKDFLWPLVTINFQVFSTLFRPPTSEDSRHQDAYLSISNRHYDIEELVLLLSFECIGVLSYCLSYVATGNRRTALLTGGWYGIMQFSNVASFLLCLFGIFLHICYLLGNRKLRRKEQNSCLDDLLLQWTENLGYLFLFLSAFLLTIQVGHPQTSYQVFEKSLATHWCGIIFIYLVFMFICYGRISMVNRIVSFYSHLFSFLYAFGSTSVILLFIIHWEGQSQTPSWFLPLYSWYDTHDDIHYYSFLQQTWAFCCCLLLSILLELLKIVLLVRWQMFTVIRVFSRYFGERVGVKRGSLSLVLKTCLFNAILIGMGMTLALAMGTVSLIYYMSDVPMVFSCKWMFSGIVMYLSHLLTTLLYSILYFIALFGSHLQQDTSQFVSTGRIIILWFSIIMSNQPLIGYFFRGWYPFIFTDTLCWSIQLIALSTLSLHLYHFSKKVTTLFHHKPATLL